MGVEIKSAIESTNPKVHTVPVSNGAGIGTAEIALISEFVSGKCAEFNEDLPQASAVRQALEELQAKELVTSTIKASTANSFAPTADTIANPAEQVQDQEHNLIAGQAIQRLERLLDELDGLHGTARSYLAPAASS